jgi:hypothetical protein
MSLRREWIPACAGMTALGEAPALLAFIKKTEPIGSVFYSLQQ